MSSEGETKYCIYCGKEIPINAKKCKYCEEWVDEESISTNHGHHYNQEEIVTDEDYIEDNEKSIESDHENERISSPYYQQNYETSKVIPIRRLYLLMILTFGLYGIYWFYKTSSYLKDDLGKDTSVGFRTFLLFIPIVNIIVFYELIEDMKKFIEEKGIESYSSGLNTLLWAFVPILGLWVYINIQESINEFWRMKEPNLPIRRDFSNGEIAAMILGIVMIIFIILLYIVLIITIASNMYYPYYYY